MCLPLSFNEASNKSIGILSSSRSLFSSPVSSISLYSFARLRESESIPSWEDTDLFFVRVSNNSRDRSWLSLFSDMSLESEPSVSLFLLQDSVKSKRPESLRGEAESSCCSELDNTTREEVVDSQGTWTE